MKRSETGVKSEETTTAGPTSAVLCFRSTHNAAILGNADARKLSEQFAPNGKCNVARFSSMQQIARSDAVDVGKAAICIGVKVEASDEVKQPAIGAVRNRHRQRRFIENVDVGSDQTAEQS